MLVPWKALNGTHRIMTQCNRGAERKRQRLAAEEERLVTDRTFSAYGIPLDMVTPFKYLEWVISATDDNWSVMVRNLSQAKKFWIRMSRILIREGAAPRVFGLFFKAVIQAVLIFGEETWVITPRTGKALEWFQNQAARWLTGNLSLSTTDRKSR